MTDGITEDVYQTPLLGSVAAALWSQAESRRVAVELSGAGVPALMLKGPDLQQRLYGTPAAYASADVDVLVPRRLASRARAVLARDGWRFEPENGVLWRMSAAATFVREGSVSICIGGSMRRTCPRGRSVASKTGSGAGLAWVLPVSSSRIPPRCSCSSPFTRKVIGTPARNGARTWALPRG